MKRKNEGHWRRVWRLSLLVGLLLPLLGTQGERMGITEARMMRLVERLQGYCDTNGSYPLTLDELQWQGREAGAGQSERLDAWGRTFFYRGCRDRRGQVKGYWLGSSCGKRVFGGFLRPITGQEPEAGDMIVHNGRFITRHGETLS